MDDILEKQAFEDFWGRLKDTLDIAMDTGDENKNIMYFFFKAGWHTALGRKKLPAYRCPRCLEYFECHPDEDLTKAYFCPVCQKTSDGIALILQYVEVYEDELQENLPNV